MIIDRETVITGSFNFTKAAEEKNAENLLIIRSSL
jgi:phosphatidylserine/phosphatidylglycerophosphate/cardiolipin synthase-like enzyme